MQSRIYIICWFSIWIIIAYRKFTIVHSRGSIRWKFSLSTKIKSMSSNQRHFGDWKSESIAYDGRKSIEIICFLTFSLARKLKRLNLGGNELTSVPQRSLSIFDNLKKLEIQENKIRSIKEGDFEGKKTSINAIFLSLIRIRVAWNRFQTGLMSLRFHLLFIFFAFYLVFLSLRLEEFGLANFGT